MKKFIPLTIAAGALASGIAAGAALAFPPGAPSPHGAFAPAAFGGPMGGQMGGPMMAGPEGMRPMPVHARDGRGPRHEMRHDDRRGPRGAQGSGHAGTIEERAERLKERLKITDAQSREWQAVVDVMREQQKAFAAARAEFWQKRAVGETPQPQTLPQRLAERDKAMTERLESQRKFTQAFGALYGSMTDDQKKLADELLSGRHHRR